MKQIRIRGRTRQLLGALALGAAVVGLTLAGRASTASALGGGLSVAPSTSTVAPGTTFTVAIRSQETVATSGVQTDLTFNPAVVQIVSLLRGSAYPADAGGSFLCSPACGTLTAGIAPQTVGDAIVEANSTGTLKNAAMFYATAGGEPAVPAGDNEVMVVVLKAIGAASTSSVLNLSNAEVLDAAGNDPSPTLTNGSVSVAASTGSLFLSPVLQTVMEGQTFTVSVMQTTGVAMSGVQSGLLFNPARLKVISIDRGGAYPADAGISFLCSPSCGALTAGTAPQTVAQAITEANASGWLKNVAMYYAPAGGEPSVPAGTNEAVKVTMQLLTGNVLPNEPLTLLNPEMINDVGNPLVGGTTGAAIRIWGDGCPDAKEALIGLDYLNPWDFYSVPVPALFASGSPTTDFNDAVVSGADAQAVFAYVKKGAKTGTLEYEQDLNLNGVKDGLEYDRSVVAPGMSGPADGVVSGADAQLAFAQAKHGYHC